MVITMDEVLYEKIERNKARADIFIRDKTKTFIVDQKKTYYFCYIKKSNDETVLIIPFKGLNANIPIELLWVDVVVLDKYKEKSE